MSAALAIAERPDPPDPPQDRPASIATPAAPTNIARLLVLIRWIIGYGTELAANLPQRASQPGFRFFANRGPTADLTLILARIRRGLMVAAALQQKLAARAAKGRDITPPLLRVPALAPPRPATPPKPRAPRRTNIVDLPLDRLPSAAEIAAELRRRPIGAILVDICRDFGIRPGDMSSAQWQELSAVVLLYDGSVITLMFREHIDALNEMQAAQQPDCPPPDPPAAQQAAAAVLATGPP